MIQRHIMKAFSLALVLGIGSFYSSEVLAQSIILRSGQVNGQHSSFSGDQNPLMGTGQLGTASQGNIEDFLVSGLNHLYIYQRDQGGSVSGLIFSANITIESIESVPESISGWSLLGFGAFALTTTRFKTKN